MRGRSLTASAFRIIAPINVRNGYKSGRAWREATAVIMNESKTHGPLYGRRIALPETREAERLALMVREQGAETVSCPLVSIVDAADPMPVQAWLHRFVDTPFDDLILLTGEGLRRLCAAAARSGIEQAFLGALAKPRKITRGPKPARALREIGLAPDLRAEEPTTEGIINLLAQGDLHDRRVGVQLYPGASNRLVHFLASAGAAPDPVVPYAYASQAEDERVAALIDEMAAGRIDVIAFTSAPQIRRLFDVAHASARVEKLRAALQKTIVAAIGPVVSAELERRGVTATIMPSGGAYFMKPMVSAIIAATSR
jgi:uroporphyrinogen-III synthase